MVGPKFDITQHPVLKHAISHPNYHTVRSALSFNRTQKISGKITCRLLPFLKINQHNYRAIFPIPKSDKG